MVVPEPMPRYSGRHLLSRSRDEEDEEDDEDEDEDDSVLFI